MSDRRVALEAVAYGDDQRISPGDRIRALELLKEYERSDSAVDGLTPEEVERELDDFYAAMIGAVFVVSGPEAVETGELDAARFPRTAQALRSVIGRTVERLAEERELAGHWGETLDPLPEPEAEPEVVVVPEPVEEGALASGAARRELPRGIDPAAGWPR